MTEYICLIRNKFITFENRSVLDSIYILQHYINNCFQKLNMPNLSVASVLILLPLAAVFIICYRWVMRKEAFRE